MQACAWQSQPDGQSALAWQGGRQALPESSGTHFQPTPHSSERVQLEHASISVPASQTFVVVLQTRLPVQPATVQSAGHSAPVQARQLPPSQMLEPVQGMASLHEAAAPHMPAAHTWPTGHTSQFAQPHSTAAQNWPSLTETQDWSPLVQSAMPAQGNATHASAWQMSPKVHSLSVAHFPVLSSSPHATRVMDTSPASMAKRSVFEI